jgi:hypothetical protein
MRLNGFDDMPFGELLGVLGIFSQLVDQNVLQCEMFQLRHSE